MQSGQRVRLQNRPASLNLALLTFCSCFELGLAIPCFFDACLDFSGHLSLHHPKWPKWNLHQKVLCLSHPTSLVVLLGPLMVLLPSAPDCRSAQTFRHCSLRKSTAINFMALFAFAVWLVGNFLLMVSLGSLWSGVCEGPLWTVRLDEEGAQRT